MLPKKFLILFIFFPLALGTEPQVFVGHSGDTTTRGTRCWLLPRCTRPAPPCVGAANPAARPLLRAGERFLFPGVSFAENLIVLVAAAGLEAFPHPDGISGCWDVPGPNELRGSCVSPDQECLLSQ